MNPSVAIRRSALIVFAVAVLFLTTILVVGNDAEAATGSDTPVVYIATGENFPDALGVGPVAALAHGPVLFVARNSIPSATQAELTRLHPDRIVIVGGTAVISTQVESQLKTWAPVSRLAGGNRYETAVAVSQAGFPSPQLPAVFVESTYASWEDPDYTQGFVMEESVYVEVPSWLDVSGQVAFASDASSPSDTVACGLTLGTNASMAHEGSWRYPTISTADPRPTCATQTLLEVDPGWHSVRLTVMNKDSTTYAVDRNLIVRVIPIDPEYAAASAETSNDVPPSPIADD